MKWLDNFLRTEKDVDPVILTESKDLNDELFAFSTQEQADAFSGRRKDGTYYCDKCGFSTITSFPQDH
jgi:hypothetical protein